MERWTGGGDGDGEEVAWAVSDVDAVGAFGLVRGRRVDSFGAGGLA